jgi:DNA repair exonuclease SbcCD ATPase subunit
VFDLYSVTLEDFKSYAGKHEFVFPEEPGLYFLTGSNELEPRLGSNGAGKSTLLDAIYWCLYGKTLRGLKAGDVVTWGKKSCTVTVNTGTNLITRTQNPNSLEIDGRVVEQKELEGHIGIAPDAFTYSVMMPQYNQSFFELTPTNKLALFSQILNLDYWLVHSKHAAEQAAEVEKEIANYSRQIGAIEIAIESSSKEIKTLIDSRDNFDAQREAELDALTAESARLAKVMDEVVAEHTSLTEDLSEITIAINELQVEYEDQTKAKDACVAKASALDKECAVLNSKATTAKNAILKLTDIGAECPTCLQKVNASHLKKEHKRAEAELKALQAKLEATQNKWEEAKAIEQKALSVNSIRYRELTDLQAKERKVARQVQYLEVELNTYKQKLTGLNDKMDEKPTNPYVLFLAEKREKLKGYKTKQAKMTSEIAALNADYEAVNFWVSGFKRVRLHIIEEALNALEIEVNNSLTNLGLVGWSIEFDVERENKSGSVTKGFMVFVRAPGQPEPTRLEAWSGGESQRLQLACDLGLANLIMQQAGITNTIEFYDEPSKHLSKAGLVDLAETLHQRAIDDNKRIFLVDHNMPEFGEFADVITVTKDENGSVIE